MNVSLSPELKRFIRNQVASGTYRSASAVVREALLLLQEIDRSRQTRQELVNVRLR